MEDGRDEGGRFLPGARANLKDRPKIPGDQKTRFKKMTPQAIEVLEKCLSSADEKIRLEAAKHILDRAYGRPSQSTELKLELELDSPAAHVELRVELGQRWRRPLIEGSAVLIGQAGQA